MTKDRFEPKQMHWTTFFVILISTFQIQIQIISIFCSTFFQIRSNVRNVLNSVKLNFFRTQFQMNKLRQNEIVYFYVMNKYLIQFDKPLKPLTIYITGTYETLNVTPISINWLKTKLLLIKNEIWDENSIS